MVRRAVKKITGEPPLVNAYDLVRAYSVFWSVKPESSEVLLYVRYVMDAYGLDNYVLHVVNAMQLVSGADAWDLVSHPPVTLEDAYLAAPSLSMQQVLHKIETNDFLDAIYTVHEHGFAAYKRLLQRKLSNEAEEGEEGWISFVSRSTRLGYVYIPAFLSQKIPPHTLLEVKVRVIDEKEARERYPLLFFVHRGLRRKYQK
ncbi:MAG: hypothetical protein QXJ59_00550 [Thermofilaceae archaeon]